MGLFTRLMQIWGRLPGDQRRYYEHNIRWVFTYMIFIPVIMYIFVFKVTEIQKMSQVRANVPAEVNQDNFEKWLKEQQAKGRFINDK